MVPVGVVTNPDTRSSLIGSVGEHNKALGRYVVSRMYLR